MGQIAGPYGLRVVKNLGEGYNTMGMHTYRISNASTIATTGLFYGDPVGLQGGDVVPLTATPTAGVPGVLGVFLGASWQDPLRGFVNSQYVPAGLFSGGASDLRVKIYDWPHPLMRIQADGPVTLAQVGLNASLGNFSAGSVATGNSKVNLASASIAAGATLALRIVDFVRDAAPSPGAGSLPGDPFTDVLVTWNFGIDRYLNATGG